LAALADLPDLAARLSEALDAARIPHAVSGAVALGAHGFVRATADIDVLVVVPSIRLPEVFSIVRGLGFQGDDADLIEAIRQRFVAEMRAGPATVELLVPVLPYHRSLVDRAVRLPVGGRSVPFVSAEDLVVLKMLWRRTKDVADVQALLAAKGRSLDRDYVKRTLRSILPDDDPRHAEIDALWKRFASGGA
jgi:predicted nucleotidyltransferase